MFYSLYAPPKVVAGYNIPGVGLAPPIEDFTIPNSDRIEKAMAELLRQEP